MTAAEHHGPTYQPAVDGLRAVAILSVVAFHIGTPFATGGFVGVDIFFVISGYLIIGQIEAGLRHGDFRFADFYARRTLRILPPLLVVLAASTIAALLLLVSEHEFDRFGGSLAHAALMIVNHYFLGQQGYFDTAANAKPLLHMWTLSVEEQFYLFAPIVVLALLRLRLGNIAASARLDGASVAVLFIASLAACIALTRAGENPAFYVMPLRAWEFIAGGVIVAIAVPACRLSARAINALAVAGAAIVLVSVTLLRPDAPFPSFLAILPVAGAVLLILATLVRPENPVSRVLALPPMAAIGLVSYSWYLWHWPMLVFARIVWGEPAFAADLAAAGASLSLAALTYMLLERPLKMRRGAIFRAFGAHWIVTAGIAGCLTFAALGFLIEGQAARLAIGGYDGLSEATLPDGSPAPCTLADDETPETCLRLAGNARAGLLVGDSHAANVYPTLFRLANAKDVFLGFEGEGGCAPLAETATFRDGELDWRCPDLFASASSDRKIDFAVLQARWVFYLGAPRTDPDPIGIAAIAPRGETAPSKDQYATFEKGLGATIRALRERGARRILIVGPEPEFLVRPVECVARADRYGTSRESCALPRAQTDARRREAVAVLRRTSDANPDVRFVDPTDVFCDRDLCRPVDGNTLLYADDDHLSPAGEELLYRAFESDFAWAFGG